MKKSKIHLLILLMTACAFLTACKEDILSTTDEDVQLALDIEAIDNYIAEKGYAGIDTTNIGIRYLVMETGNGDPIDPNSIVSYNLTASLISDEIWFTLDRSVAIENDIYFAAADSLGLYTPEIFTYTADGWNVNELFNDAYSLERGYRSGVGAVLGEINVGGHARFMVPSYYAYKGISRLQKIIGQKIAISFIIPPNSVIIYDIYPTYVRY